VLAGVRASREVGKAEEESEEEIIEKTKNYIDLLNQKLGFGISEEEYPEIRITKHASSQYSPDSNIMVINGVSPKGDDFGEEIGHFLRRRFVPDSKERLTNEFFGFIGRRLLKNEIGDQESFSLEFENRTESLQEIKRKKEKALNYLDLSEDQQSKYYRMRAKQAMQERSNILHHQRGYYFASRVDITKIHDWKKLFTMPDQEVRRRFFTTTPDYSGL